MNKLLIITGDIAAGKTHFSEMLARRYDVPVFQKDPYKEVLSDIIGFKDRAENKTLSVAAVAAITQIFSDVSKTGQDLILEANFHDTELQKLHDIAREREYEVLTLVLQGDLEVLYERYMNRLLNENRHPAHNTTTMDVHDEFIRIVSAAREEAIMGDRLDICVTDLSYQTDESVLSQIDKFMR